MVRCKVASGPSKAERDAETKRVEHIKTLGKPLVNLRESILKQTDFSSSLSKHVISTAANDTNFVFSPLSIHVVLSMASAGSSGPTKSQLLDFLNSNSVEDLNSLSSQVATLLLADGGPLGGPRLSFPNGVWVDQTLTFNPAFKEIVENDYKVASHQVDFLNKADEARKGVNAWAEKETNGLIKDLLPPGSVNHLTRLIAANALYFKGYQNAVKIACSNSCNLSTQQDYVESIEVEPMVCLEVLESFTRGFNESAGQHELCGAEQRKEI